MSIDKFGRHINNYYFNRLQDQSNLSYNIILTFEGSGATTTWPIDTSNVNPKDVLYAYILLENHAINYIFPFETAIIDRVHYFQPIDVTIYLNGKGVEKIEGQQLKLNDSLMFLRSNPVTDGGKMFIQLILKCPINK